MRKRYLLVLIGILTILSLQAQEKCGFTSMMQEARQKGFRDEVFEANLARLIQQRVQSKLNFTGPVTIPVIFHVIYRNGDAEGAPNSPNLSQAQIQAQINQLNIDFANSAGSGYGVAANTQIQFCAAVVDPGGVSLVQPGIHRINGEVQGWSDTDLIGTPANLQNEFNTVIKPASIWDPYRYLNIWTADIGASGLLGFATFPSLSGLPDLPVNAGETDQTAGVVVAAGSVGSNSSQGYLIRYNRGRTLTHEMGHFLGLRHIWGDSNCGNDFCADTPVQQDETLTVGCPTVGHPLFLQNCPTPGSGIQRMFENYMDYSDDVCMNTFTNDQALRAQTVMDNGTRRLALLTSTVCTPPVANAIAFLSVSTTTNEAPTVLTCPRYKEITVSLRAAVAASGDATVTFAKSGTATEIADYTITPASVSFTNGDNTTKNITVRINDDATVEVPETIILTYTITGTGVVSGTVAQSHTITIVDNDLLPVITNNSGAITIFSEDFDPFPSDWISGNIPFPGNPAGTNLNVWTMSPNGGITGNSAHITNNIGTGVLNYDITSASQALLITPIITTTGASNPILTFNYKANGQPGNDVGLIYYSLDGMSFTQITPYIFQGVATTTAASVTLPALLENTSFVIGFFWLNNASTGNQPPFVIDDVIIATDGTRIESTVSQPVTENVFANQDVYLKSAADGQLLARIQNANADLGCLTATLSQAGNTRIPVTTNIGSYLRTEKVIQISPAIANTSVTYQGTIYFSVAELQAWVNAGVDLNDLKILKVTDGTSLAGTLNPTNSRIITPTFSDQSASGYYAFTGNFTGFSQFMLASPNISLPVDLLVFEAKAVRKSIALNWSTAQELNNKGFAIERSINGTDFETIGWVDGKINSNTRSDYSYIDHFVQPGVIYYYRLRQTDIDNREKFSMTRQAKIDEGGISLTINPNPASGQLNLFVSGSVMPAEVMLVNMQGQIVRKWSRVNASAAPYKLDINGLASGVYTLQVLLPDTKLVEKIMVR